MRRIPFVLSLLLGLFLVSLTPRAFGQAAPDAGVTQLDFAPATSGAPAALPALDSMDAYATFARMLLQAAESRDWKYLVGLVFVLLIAALRWGARWVEDHAKEDSRLEALAGWLHSEHGSRTMLFGTSALTGFSLALLAHQAVTWLLAGQILSAALLAAGGWHEIVKPYVLPLLAWLWAKTPFGKVAPVPTAPSAPPPAAP